MRRHLPISASPWVDLDSLPQVTAAATESSPATELRGRGASKPQVTGGLRR